ncbi:uncharacterized protein I206_101348 [Kwoniella pini CBS 10737]|uniref:Uncharacterized protein n=1 Tax=Kwoniella pini CBS 10737 TaxID=1296096 RepID=A0A1B9HWZ2_9TREE|nr:uncharacterized protein I206_06684 [Kwoniella pini CBS 10737]OCF47777.1 hypothetical protein I206_06684 [Kwoniella pini CBS 10737]
MVQPNGAHQQASNSNSNGVVRPWAADFNPGSKSFTTLDGKPVNWNGGWAGIDGETASNGSAPPPLTAKSGPNNTEITYLPYPELTCLHCLGSNPPGKLGYVVSYIPVVSNGNSDSNDTQQNIGKGFPTQSNGFNHTIHEEEDEHIESPVRPSAPQQGSSFSRPGRDTLRSSSATRGLQARSRSRAEERAQDLERGRQIEREAQEERARSSSVSWELAGVSKQYVPDGEDDAVVE